MDKDLKDAVLFLLKVLSTAEDVECVNDWGQTGNAQLVISGDEIDEALEHIKNIVASN